MRVIKFRGKRIDNSKWVYGDLVSNSWGCYIITHFSIQNDKIVSSIEAQVLPETVGQFTGLKDKNGKEIFEGDIVKDGWIEDNFGIVEFKEGSFDLGLSYSEYISEQYQDSEIIGNIYENPELLTK